MALPSFPGAVQIATRAGVMADSAARAQRTIEGLRTVEGLTSEVEAAERRHRELQSLLGSMTDAEFVRVERLSSLRDHALIEDGRLEGVQERLIGRLAELGELDARWVERRRLWRSWLEAPRPEGDPELPRAEMTAALDTTEEVLDSASEAAGILLDLLGRVEALRGEVAQLSNTVSTIQNRRGQARFERSEPLLFSEEHRAQLREGGWRAWDPTESLRPKAYVAFARGNLRPLVFHVILALLIAGLVRALRIPTPLEGAPERPGLFEHPWTLGVFVSVVVAMLRVTLAPPIWDVLLWWLFGATAAFLGRRFIEARVLRLTVYLLAAFYPVFLLLEVSRLPDPVFRVGLAAVAVFAIPLFLRLAHDEGPALAEGSGPMWVRAGRTWPLLLGAAIWMGILVALVAGFDALARWALHTAVMSAAVVFTVMLGLVLLRHTFVRLSGLRREGPLIQRGAALLAQRLTFALRVALVVAGALVFLDLWGATGSPIATWRRAMDAGVTVGTFEVTVGRILLGLFVVYLAVLASGLVRSLITSSAEAGRTPEGGGVLVHAGRGIAESITKLGQYAFVTLSLILALAVMGVELQNFAIVVGALGIGVGLGLQNVVNNFASGLILHFERPVRVGDTVVVGDTWGTIQKIGLRSTVMLTLDESEMIVPNGDLVSEKVINWTLTSPIARVFLPVGVAYGSPVEEVQEDLYTNLEFCLVKSSTSSILN
ncbi:MAG: mechanosensitive ion channel, partial [Longimicrobiales bacterium]